MSEMVVCGWFTPDYGHFADSLVRNLDALGLSHDIVQVEPMSGGWEKITLAKADQVLAAMKRHPTKVIVFIDVDCQVIDADRVAKLADVKGDVGFLMRARFRRAGGVKWMPRSGTLVFAPTMAARSFIQAWQAVSASAPPYATDQQCLGVAMTYAPGCSFTALDQRYCATEYDRLTDPWILHTKVTHGHKTPTWKRIVGRLTGRWLGGDERRGR